MKPNSLPSASRERGSATEPRAEQSKPGHLPYRESRRRGSGPGPGGRLRGKAAPPPRLPLARRAPRPPAAQRAAALVQNASLLTSEKPLPFPTPHSGHTCLCRSPGSLRRPAHPRRTPALRRPSEPCPPRVRLRAAAAPPRERGTGRDGTRRADAPSSFATAPALSAEPAEPRPPRPALFAGSGTARRRHWLSLLPVAAASAVARGAEGARAVRGAARAGGGGAGRANGFCARGGPRVPAGGRRRSAPSGRAGPAYSAPAGSRVVRGPRVSPGGRALPRCPRRVASSAAEPWAEGPACVVALRWRWERGSAGEVPAPK